MNWLMKIFLFFDFPIIMVYFFFLFRLVVNTYNSKFNRFMWYMWVCVCECICVDIDEDNNKKVQDTKFRAAKERARRKTKSKWKSDERKKKKVVYENDLLNKSFCIKKNKPIFFVNLTRKKKWNLTRDKSFWKL